MYYILICFWVALWRNFNYCRILSKTPSIIMKPFSVKLGNTEKGGIYLKKLLFLIVGLLLILSACGNESKSVSADDVIQQFKDDGLEVGDVSDLPEKEYGNTRKEGKRILIPSLGEDAGGRLFVFENEKDLKQAKSYYDELGNSSPLFYSHTYRSGNVLLQMNGDMSDEDFKKYTESMDKVK